MPKIAAATIEEHVTAQRAHILDQALRLFQTEGYAGVDIGSIANSVGLKRSSFYRYFSNKDDVLVACVEQAMKPVFARNQAIAQGLRPPRNRVLAWVDAQFDFATGPNHATYNLAKEIQALAPGARGRIMKLHVGLYKTLSTAVKECLAGSDRHIVAVSSMISGMVQSAAALALENGGAEAIRQELHAVVSAVIHSESVSQISQQKTSYGRQ